jgi:TrkA domain protein
MTVYETDIPGVGRKFEVEIGGGERAVVVIHHDGRREVFRRPDADADSEKVFDLGSQQARNLGSILEGAYFETVDTDDLTLPLGDAFLEWVDVTADCPIAGQTLGEARVRQRTGVSVVAVQRGGDTVANPDADFRVEAGDILVTIGTREEQGRLETLVDPDAEIADEPVRTADERDDAADDQRDDTESDD